MWIQGCHLEIKQNQIKQLGICFASIFLLFSNKSSRGATLIYSNRGKSPAPGSLWQPCKYTVSYFEKGCQRECTQSQKILWVVILSAVQYRKWSRDRKWSPKWTANDPRPQVIPKVDRKWSYGTDYKKETFFSRLLKKKGKRTLHLRSIFVAGKFKTGRTLRRKNSIIFN